MPDLDSMMGRTCSVSGVTDADGAVATVVVTTADVTASVEEVAVVVVEVVRLSFTSEDFEVGCDSSRSPGEVDEIFSLGASVDEELFTSASEDEGVIKEMLESSLVLVSVTAVSAILYECNDNLAKEALVKLAGAVVLEYSQRRARRLRNNDDDRLQLAIDEKGNF